MAPILTAVLLSFLRVSGFRDNDAIDSLASLEDDAARDAPIVQVDIGKFGVNDPGCQLFGDSQERAGHRSHAEPAPPTNVSEATLMEKVRRKVTAPEDLSPPTTNDTELPMLKEDWGKKNGVAVTLSGYLNRCGANGRPAVLRFKENGGTHGTPIEWVVIAKFSGRAFVFEPHFTYVMSLASGFSLGFVGVEIIRGSDAGLFMMTDYVYAVSADYLPKSQRLIPSFSSEQVRSMVSSFSLEQARFIMLQLLFTLGKMQLNSTVHRDIKPENMLFPRACLLHWMFPAKYPDYRTWLKDNCMFIYIDYGLACSSTGVQPSTTANGERLTCENDKLTAGSVLWMPPEVLSPNGGRFGGGWTHQGDIWAVGATAAYIFTGKWWPLDSANAIMRARKTGDAELGVNWLVNNTRTTVDNNHERLLQLVEEALTVTLQGDVIHAGLIELIKTMLSKHPKERSNAVMLLRQHKFFEGTEEMRSLVIEASDEILAKRKDRRIFSSVWPLPGTITATGGAVKKD